MKSDKYNKGMKVRREVLGDEYVDKALSLATDFTKPLQDLVTDLKQHEKLIAKLKRQGFIQEES